MFQQMTFFYMFDFGKHKNAVHKSIPINLQSVTGCDIFGHFQLHAAKTNEWFTTRISIVSIPEVIQYIF